jgi:hypothetical protein
LTNLKFKLYLLDQEGDLDVIFSETIDKSENDIDQIKGALVALFFAGKITQQLFQTISKFTQILIGKPLPKTFNQLMQISHLLSSLEGV